MPEQGVWAGRAPLALHRLFRSSGPGTRQVPPDTTLLHWPYPKVPELPSYTSGRLPTWVSMPRVCPEFPPAPWDGIVLDGPAFGIIRGKLRDDKMHFQQWARQSFGAQSSLSIPTFNLQDEAECRAFFSHASRGGEGRRWVLKGQEHRGAGISLVSNEKEFDERLRAPYSRCDGNSSAPPAIVQRKIEPHLYQGKCHGDRHTVCPYSHTLHLHSGSRVLRRQEVRSA